MYHLRPDTLAHFKQCELFRVCQHSTMVPQLVNQIHKYQSNGAGEANVEESAINFYMLNHAFSLLQQKFDPHEILPEPARQLAEAYVVQGSLIAQRLIAYTFLVITREARHLHKTGLVYEQMHSKDAVFYSFWQMIAGSGSDGAVNKLKANPPQITVAKYTELVTWLFNNGVFSGGYGGKPWGNIANALRSYVHGETSAEAFSDTAWTLAHNNGPMFNKGMLYQHYTNEIYRILDVQRSGQIPQLMADQLAGAIKLNAHLNSAAAFYKMGKAVFPEEFGGFVDWELVEAFGLKKYGTEKQAQFAKHGPSKTAKEAAEKAAAAEAAKFYVTDTEFVMIKQRAHAQAA